MTYDDSEDIFTRIDETLEEAFNFVLDSVSEIWETTYSCIKMLWGGFRALIEEDVERERERAGEDETVVVERDLRDKAQEAVLAVLGNDPLQAICNMPVNERRRMIPLLAAQIARAMGTEVSTVKIEAIGKNWNGYYSHGGKEVVISQNLVVRYPMGRDEASQLLDTLLHELYHSFQHTAILDPQKCAISQELANLWKNNFDHYISPEHNFRLYWEQSVEETARAFAHAITVRF